VAVGVASLLKKSKLFGMNSDEDKTYMEIVVFDENYNFVVQTFNLKSS
jgi:hypothetical protein